MLLTLKKLEECQGAIARVGNISIKPDEAAIMYRMSKNVENLSRSDGMRDLQREKQRILVAFGTDKPDNPGFYVVSEKNKEKYYKAIDELEAETVEIRIRPIDFMKYLSAIEPGQITPADISALNFIFQFPDDFEDEEDEKKPAKDAAGKKEKA